MEKLKIERKQKKKLKIFFLTANKFTKSINLFYIKRRASANWQLSQQGVILRPRDVVVVKDEEGDLRKRQKAKRKIKKKKWTEKWVQFREKKKKKRSGRVWVIVRFSRRLQCLCSARFPVGPTFNA